MTPEIEVLDQLLGGDLPLNVIDSLFSERSRCQRAIFEMLRSGEVTLLDPEGNNVPTWRYRDLQEQPDFWIKGTRYRIAITDKGARRVS
jgi:hypothetical protein